MRILITGATGFLGNNLVRALLENGHEVTATVRLSSDPRPLSGLDVEKRHVDLSDAADVNLAVSNADLVIHVAAMIHVGWKKLEESRQINVQSTRLLAAAARRNNIRMIHVSTVDTLAAAEDADDVVDEIRLEPTKPECAYVVSKREAEQAVLEEVKLGLDAIIVNPGFMVGPWDWKPSSGKMMLTLAKIPILFFTPAGGCSVVDVRDVADGIISAMTHGRSGERYILAGENMTYLELWRMMAKVMNKRPPVKGLSNWLASCVGGIGDLIAKVSGHESELNSAALKLGQMFHWYSSQKAEKELGYRIGDVDDALQDSWEWFKKNDYV